MTNSNGSKEGGYHAKLSPSEQKTLNDLKNMLESQHGITSEASPTAKRFQVEPYANPDLRFELELL